MGQHVAIERSFPVRSEAAMRTAKRGHAGMIQHMDREFAFPICPVVALCAVVLFDVGLFLRSSHLVYFSGDAFFHRFEVNSLQSGICGDVVSRFVLKYEH